ncbi:hypothetical protein AWW66_16095 [Micromonospora rosaria]|uniref:Uncharacterized protein n=1 Tax=Micromonospora rosaria TaxID=47874 RepID=A0A136PS05_9ACTN|nr:hypothetical protein [Micromonospora rosaria]KXK60946.1 hypothetical protein AWW66_16095 [Micromonospora rosaria]
MDAESYGRRSDWAQGELQARLVALLDGAAVAAGLDRSGWVTQGSGDGELAFAPVGGSEPRIVDDFVRHLDAELSRLNRLRVDTERLRLRLAVHQGAVRPGPNGHVGKAVVTVSRLVNSTPLRRALAAFPGANLAMILSDDVFQSLVVGEHTTYQADAFREVAVVEKEYRASAWLRVPGADVHQLDLTGTGGTVASPDGGTTSGFTGNRAAPAGAITADGPTHRHEAKVMNVFHGTVDACHANFGVAGGLGG